MMWGGENSVGFTIVETLIVLTVTSLIAVSFMISINGRQGKVQFQTAINDARTQLQQVINEASSGYFPANDNLVCSSASGAPVFTTGTSGQGTNGSCIFLGKVVQFGFTRPNDNQGFNVYSMAGNGASTAQDLGHANLRVAKPLTAQKTLLNGLEAVSMYYNNNPSFTTAAAGFLAGNANGVYAADNTDGGAGLMSGSQQSSLYAIKSTVVTSSTEVDLVGNDAGVPGKLNTSTANYAAAYTRVTSVSVCLKSGTTNQSGLLTFGGGAAGNYSRQLSVNVEIKNNLTCA